MKAVHAFHRSGVQRTRLQAVVDVHSADHEHPVILLLDLSANLRGQPAVARIYPARLQRAAKGSYESPAGRRHHIVEGCRDLTLGIGSVVFPDRAVHPESHRTLVGWKPSVAVRPLKALDADVGDIDGFVHWWMSGLVA